MNQYQETMRTLAQGWNTWDNDSVLSHVLLPDCLRIRLGFIDAGSGQHIHEASIGQDGAGAPSVRVSARSLDGGYTELELAWQTVHVRVRSAARDGQLVLLVTPLAGDGGGRLTAQVDYAWSAKGDVTRTAEGWLAENEGGSDGSDAKRASHRVYLLAAGAEGLGQADESGWAVLSLQAPVAICVGTPMTLAHAAEFVGRAKDRVHISGDDDLDEIRQAVRTSLAWNTIYDGPRRRVITPVSRQWSKGCGGYVLFCWDTFFAACMAGSFSKELAYANLVEIVKEVPGLPFVPNVSLANKYISRDRSQPPVGSLMALEIFRRFGEPWILGEVFDDLLAWNRWWPKARANGDWLSWGSDPFEPVIDSKWEKPEKGVGGRQGGAFESGLDNSPMYDGIPFDSGRHVLELADVGLTGLYAADCLALAEIAGVLDRTGERDELARRGETYRASLQSLWDDRAGIFKNRRTDTGELSDRLSPTNFYPLLCRGATDSQARRMVSEHLLSEREFWGEWVLPSVPRNDPAYVEQDYWRGRIWGPMNFLVYLGLRNYPDLADARSALADKSGLLLLKEWRQSGHIHENYSAVTGQGCGTGSSDAFYHWGGLLGLIAMMEE